MASTRDRDDFFAVPASREPVTLLSVDRAVSELRRGLPVALSGAGGRAVLVRAAEAATSDALQNLSERTGNPVELVITARRAAVLGLETAVSPHVFALAPKSGPWTAEAIHSIADPLSIDAPMAADEIIRRACDSFDCETAAVQLTKLARLLPAALISPLDLGEKGDLNAWTMRSNIYKVDAGDIFQYDRVAARTLRAVSEANVPLDGADQAKIIAFRPLDGGLEHLAIVIGDADLAKPVLTRLHSECFTGDLLGSLRCDCGDQLRGAIHEIAKAGGGVLLYLAQEGRGIGLVNKLRAYELQDRGADTMDANEQLGFDADERVYLPAARMLRALGVKQVRLLTNNPEKVQALAASGMDVTERVTHRFPSNRHNEAYLQTKAAKGGHLF